MSSDLRIQLFYMGKQPSEGALSCHARPCTCLTFPMTPVHSLPSKLFGDQMLGSLIQKAHILQGKDKQHPPIRQLSNPNWPLLKNQQQASNLEIARTQKYKADPAQRGPLPSPRLSA